MTNAIYRWLFSRLSAEKFKVLAAGTKLYADLLPEVEAAKKRASEVYMRVLNQPYDELRKVEQHLAGYYMRAVLDLQQAGTYTKDELLTALKALGYSVDSEFEKFTAIVEKHIHPPVPAKAASIA